MNLNIDPAPVLSIDNLRVNRGNNFQLFVDNFRLYNGEVLAIIGPNGAGKSTFLLSISKLLKPSAGAILFRDQPVDGIKDLEYRRKIALVLQEPLLLDTTVYENIAVGLKYRKVAKPEREMLISDWLSRLNITHLKDRPASQLSGGQAQRVSLARALVLNPEILLLDEPFRALDVPSRNLLLQDLRRVLTETGITTLYITHDQERALFLGDRVAVLLDGNLRQVGSPQEVFSSPIDPQVAEFLGVENVLAGKVIDNIKGKLVVDVGGTELEAIGGMEPEQNVLFCIRPEDITLWKTTDLPESSARNQLFGKVASVSAQGALFQVTLDCGFPFVVLITRASARELELKEGMRISALFKASAVHLIPH